MARLAGLRGASRRALAAMGLGALLVTAGHGCFEPRKYPGPRPCTSVADCDDSTVCTVDYCEDGTCQHDPLTRNGPDDGSSCTRDQCLDGVELHEPTTKVNAPCGMLGALVCDLAGQCTGCETAQQCGTSSPCRTWQCSGGLCVAIVAAAGTACSGDGICDASGSCAQCNDELQNAGETDVDCGGRCAAQNENKGCAEGQRCDVDADCQTGSTCAEGICCADCAAAP